MPTKSQLFIDPRLHYIGTSKLRQMKGDFLRCIGEDLYVVQDGDEQLAVILSYAQYLEIQAQLEQSDANRSLVIKNPKKNSLPR